MKIDSAQYVWAEKYRPQSIDDLVFPEKYKEKLREWIADKEIPHIGVFGSIPGTGKSSLLNVLMKELNTDTDIINGSKDNGIDAMRGRIAGFASNQSVSGQHKLMCIDEADYLTIPAQASLRSDLEAYSKNCRFIFTGNYTDRIIEPLMKRLQVFDLDKMYQENKKELALQIFNRLTALLQNEEIEFERTELMQVVKTFYPATRDMIMFLQQNTVDNVVRFDELQKPDDAFSALIIAMKNRKFRAARDAVSNMVVPENFYTYLWNNLDTHFQLSCQPDIIIWLADYQDMSARAKNKQIPLSAMVNRIIGDPDVKFIE